MQTVTVCYYVAEGRRGDDSSSFDSTAGQQDRYYNASPPNAFELLVPATITASAAAGGGGSYSEPYFEVLLLDVVNFLRNYACGDRAGTLAVDPSEHDFYSLAPVGQAGGQYQSVAVSSLATCLCHSNQQAWRAAVAAGGPVVLHLLLRRTGAPSARASTVHPHTLLGYFHRQPLRPLPRPPRAEHWQHQARPSAPALVPGSAPRRAPAPKPAPKPSTARPAAFESSPAHATRAAAADPFAGSFDPFASPSGAPNADPFASSSGTCVGAGDTRAGDRVGFRADHRAASDAFPSQQPPRPATAANRQTAASAAASTAAAAAATGHALFSSFLNTVTTVAGTVNSSAQSALGSVVLGSAGLGTGAGLGTLKLQNGTGVRIQRELAEGGFSTVFLACHADGEGRRFALKQVKCQSRDSVRAAANELAMLQRFHCPNIISVLDWLVQQQQAPGGLLCTYYYLFPLYPDGSAWDAIEKFMNYTGANTNHNPKPSAWPFPEAIALEIMVGVSRALEVIHGEGFCHRDVKPHNVLLRYGGGGVQPVLMDLGSMTAARTGRITSKARASDIEEEANSNTSPAYKPPELVAVPYNAYTYAQVAPNACPDAAIELDERIDVWSLGCVMFALAFGMSPFESLSEGVKKLGILNASYTVPSHNLSPLPPRSSSSGGGGGGSSDWTETPLSMPPPLPARGKRGTAAGGREQQDRPSSALPCQTQFSPAYVQLIQSMLQLDFNERPFVGTVRSRCEEILSECR